MALKKVKYFFGKNVGAKNYCTLLNPNISSWIIQLKTFNVQDNFMMCFIALIYIRP